MVSDFVEEIIEKNISDPRLKEIVKIHSEMVAGKAVSLALKNKLADRVDMQFLEDAAMLHDIGVVNVNAPSIHCHGTEPYICHGIEGGRILREAGLEERYCRVCERHTGSGITKEDIIENHLPLPERDFLPETLEERLICYADKFFSKSRDLRYEKTQEEIERSMKKFGEASLKRYEELRNEFGS